jgi:hypothetical protein
MVNVAFQRRIIKAGQTQPKHGSVIAAAQTIAESGSLEKTAQHIL